MTDPLQSDKTILPATEFKYELESSENCALFGKISFQSSTFIPILEIKASTCKSLINDSMKWRVCILIPTIQRAV